MIDDIAQPSLLDGVLQANRRPQDQEDSSFKEHS
jgi:hypothetical protein